ncbi:hypothetical protein, partial [Deinococcus pimensis]|uniref:hypothetical protein n=1 Tax=Deinococcus pimensis TaxID=309888 RepID=UPI000694939D
MSSTPEPITQAVSSTDGTASNAAFVKPARNHEDATEPTELRALREALLRGARHRAAWERAHEVAERLLDRPG